MRAPDRCADNSASAYVPQDPSFDGAHTIEEVLAQVLIDTGLDPHDHSDRMSAALSLGEFPATGQSTATLSGGWKKRLAIVRSLDAGAGRPPDGRTDQPFWISKASCGWNDCYEPKPAPFSSSATIGVFSKR